MISVHAGVAVDLPKQRAVAVANRAPHLRDGRAIDLQRVLSQCNAAAVTDCYHHATMLYMYIGSGGGSGGGGGGGSGSGP